MYPVADEFQQEVERTAAEYDEAVTALKKAEADIQENTVRIDELSAEIPEQQQRGATAARELYKLQQQESGLLQMLLGSEDFYGFLMNLDYLNRVSDEHTQELTKLSDMKTELEDRRVALEKAHSSATKQADKAEEALKAAQDARVEAQRRAQEEARRQAEEAAAQAAAEAEAAAAAAAAAEAEAAANDAAAADDTAEEEAASAAASEEAADDASAASESAEDASETDDSDAEEEASSEAEAEPAEEAVEEQPVIEQPTDDGADWTSDQAAFINEWAARIDAYLAGSALDGQGTTFAKAAWDYGVDPRWSPAIAFTESSLGANCFHPYNAWGWGSASWGSWEEAIPAHVGGLARGYGYTISVEAAQKYCPPNWQAWYDRTLSQMNMI